MLDKQFAKIVKKIHIDEDILELVKNSLLDSHKEEKDFHDKRIKILQEQYNKLQHRLDKIYIDKIDDKISEQFYEEKTDAWQEEQKELLRQMKNIRTRTPITSLKASIF